MKSKLDNFIHSGYSFSIDEEDIKYKFIFLNSIMGFATIAVLMVAIIRFIQGNLLIASVDLTFSAITIFLLYGMRIKKHKIEFFSNILLFITYLLFTAIVLFVDTQLTRISIYLLLIAAAYFLKGKRRGFYWLLLIVTTICFIQFSDKFNTGYSDLDIYIFFTYVATFYFMINIYESIKLSQTKNLIYLNNNLEEIVKQRTAELQNEKEILQVISSTDSLTGLYNRSKLEETFKYEQKQSIRYNTQLSIILMDIDFFKEVNDLYGHNIGDEFLIEISNELNIFFRDTDTVGRWGGEEFLIILPKSSIKSAQNIAERIRSIIEKIPFNNIGHKTASFGVASLIDGDELSTIVHRADEALYISKSDGRNKVSIA